MDISNRILRLQPASIADANPQRRVAKVFEVIFMTTSSPDIIPQDFLQQSFEM
jgi:hypothetical protein